MKEGLLFVIIFSFFLIALLLLRKKPFSYYFYIFNYFILTTGVLSFYAFYADIYQVYPHLSKIQSPLGYLNGPAAYFFVLFTLHPSRRLKWTDLLHLLPFSLHLLELIPYYRLSVEDKRVLMNNFDFQSIWHVKHGLVLTLNQHAFLKALSILIYTFFQLKVTYAFVNKSNKLLLKQNTTLLKWVASENILKLLLILALIICLIIARLDPNFPLNNLPPLIFSANLLLSFSFMFIYPEILQGLKLVQIEFNPPQLEVNAENEGDEQHDLTETTKSTNAKNLLPVYKPFFEKIEAYMQTRQPFLDEHFSRQTLADELSLPLKKITETIFVCSGLHFADYVNTYRLDFVSQQLRFGNPAWKDFTLEAIAHEAGFGNRTSFHNAVKRMKNMTPSAFIQASILS